MFIVFDLIFIYQTFEWIPFIFKLMTSSFHQLNFSPRNGAIDDPANFLNSTANPTTVHRIVKGNSKCIVL